MHADGRQHDEVCVPVPLAFAAGDVVAFQMERAPGVDGVLRVQVEGRRPREFRGLPREGVMYPVVGLAVREQ